MLPSPYSTPCRATPLLQRDGADFAWEEEVHGTVQRFWLLVEDSESSKILTKLLFTLRKFQLNSRLRFHLLRARVRAAPAPVLL